MPRLGKSLETESKLAVSRAGGWKMGMIANEHKVSFLGIKNVPELDSGNGYTAL